jgi:hypothetical protein
VTEPEKPIVYLAETTADLKEEHEAIKRDLRQHGHRVLPESPLPLVATDLKAAIQEQLRQSQLSIHLVGKNYSLVPEGSEESLIEIQNDLAIERSEEGGFTRLLWLPPKLVIDDERQRALVAQLRSNPRLHGDGDLLETPLEDLKTLIQTRLSSPSKPVRESTEVKQLYLIYDSRDQDAIAPWQKFLFEKGLEIIHPLFEGSESEIREYHEENLRICHAVLIYYGAGNEAWLRRKIREVQKSAAYGRAEPISVVGVLLGAPRTPQKERFQTHECTVIPQWDGLEPEPLLPFIQQIGEKKMRAV